MLPGLRFSGVRRHFGAIFAAGSDVEVTVRNTGSVAGKEVVMIMDPFLTAFGKTRLLQPGESQTLSLHIE